jgi:hypothetical protein
LVSSGEIPEGIANKSPFASRKDDFHDQPKKSAQALQRGHYQPDTLKVKRSL